MTDTNTDDENDDRVCPLCNEKWDIRYKEDGDGESKIQVAKQVEGVHIRTCSDYGCLTHYVHLYAVGAGE